MVSLAATRLAKLKTAIPAFCFFLNTFVLYKNTASATIDGTTMTITATPPRSLGDVLVDENDVLGCVILVSGNYGPALADYDKVTFELRDGSVVSAIKLAGMMGLQLKDKG